MVRLRNYCTFLHLLRYTVLSLLFAKIKGKFAFSATGDNKTATFIAAAQQKSRAADAALQKPKMAS